MSDSIDKMIVRWKKDSFSGMKFAVSRLKGIEELIRCEVISNARRDNALDDLRYSGKIGNWPVYW